MIEKNKTNSKKHKPIIIDLIKLNNKYHLYNKNNKHKFKVKFIYRFSLINLKIEIKYNIVTAKKRQQRKMKI